MVRTPRHVGGVSALWRPQTRLGAAEFDGAFAIVGKFYVTKRYVCKNGRRVEVGRHCQGAAESEDADCGDFLKVPK